MPHWVWKTCFLLAAAAAVLGGVAFAETTVQPGSEGRVIASLEFNVKQEGRVYERAPDSVRRHEVLNLLRTRLNGTFSSEDLDRDITTMTTSRHWFREVDADVSIIRDPDRPPSENDPVRVRLIVTQPLVKQVRFLTLRGSDARDELGDLYRHLTAVDTAEGSEFSLRRLDGDARRLTETGAFLSVRPEYLYTAGGVDVVFRVILNEPLAIVAFSGIHAPGFDADLRRVIAGRQPASGGEEIPDSELITPVYFPLGAFDGDVVTDASAASILGAKAQIQAFYRARGYHFAEVTDRVISLPAQYDKEMLERGYGTMRATMHATLKQLIEDGYGGRTVLVFEVFEGEQLRIGRVVFHGIQDVDSPGNDALSVSRLGGLFSIVYQTWYGVFAPTANRKSAVLAQLMRSAEGGDYVESNAIRDAEALQSYLRQRGWLDARVSYGGFQLNEVRSRVNLEFHVDPGAVYAVSDIRIEYGTREPRVPQGAEPPEFDAPVVTFEELLETLRLRADEIPHAEAVERFTEAYISAQNDSAQGKHLGAFDLRSPIPWDDHEFMGSAGDAREGMAGAIRTLLADRGYSNIEVSFERVETESETLETDWKTPWPVRRVGLILRIQQGYQSIVGNVRFRGNIETRDDVLRRYVDLYPGDVYDRNRLRASDMRLRRTQWFEQGAPGQGVISRTSPRLVVRDGEYVEYTDVDYDLEEGATNRLNFSAGFSTATGFTASIDVTLMNFDISSAFAWMYGGRYTGFVGAGQSLSFTAQPPLDRQQIYRVSFNEPWLFGYPLSGGVSAEYTAIDFGDYTSTRTGIDPVLGWRVYPDVLWSFGYSYAIHGLSDVSPSATPEIRASEGRDVLSTVWSEISWNTTDNPMFPTTGHALSYRFAYTGGPVLGGTLDFWRMRAHAGYYLPIAEIDPVRSLVLAFNINAHWQDVHSDTTQIPFLHRFLMGGNVMTGRGLLRGFEFAGVGPSRNDQAIGGNFMVHGFTELRFPIFPGNLWAVGFLDVGQLSPTLNTFDPVGWTASGGAGLRLLLPILPVPFALDFGFPIYNQPGNREQVISINLGFSFAG